MASLCPHPAFQATFSRRREKEDNEGCTTYSFSRLREKVPGRADEGRLT